MNDNHALAGPEHDAWLHSLVTGSIHGMWLLANDFAEKEPGKYPPLDDSVMFDVAVLLAATIVEGNPDYRNAAAFDQSGDMARTAFVDRLHEVRRLSEARGSATILTHIEKATGKRPFVSERH